MTMKDICKRLESLRTYNIKDSNILQYILDLVCLYQGANPKVKISLVKQADIYLTGLEISFYNHFNNLGNN